MKLVMKTIRIKFHIRDVRILTKIQNHLHMGIIRYDKNKPYVIYNISRKEDMIYVLNNLNGLIRIKVLNYKKALDYFNINYIEPDYNIKLNDPYFAGLIDTDGSIVFNYPGNRIECKLELKYNEYSSKLNLNNVIPNYKPSIFIKNKDLKIKSIIFSYQTVKNMIDLYDYFMINRLFSDFKFYRISKISRFIEIRSYQKSDKNSLEFYIYSQFLLD